MNTRKNSILLAVILTIAALLLSACKSTEQTESPTPTLPEPTTRPTQTAPPEATAEPLPEATTTPSDPYADVDPAGQTVRFWHAFTGERQAALLEIAADFNAENEWGITVIPEYQGEPGELHDRVLTFMNTSDAPQLVVADSSQAAAYQLGEALVDLDEFISNETWGLGQEEIDDFYPALLEQGVFSSFDEARLGFPLFGVMDVLYYNADWLGELGYQEIPETPDRFAEAVCAAALQPYSNATAAGRWGYQLNLEASRFASWTYAFGGKIFDFGAEQYHFDHSATLEAMTFLQTLINRGCAKTAAAPEEDLVNFGRGVLLFAAASSDKIPEFRSSVQSEANFNWRVASLPHSSANPTVNVEATNVSIPKTSPVGQLAAWLFLQYFSQPNVQAKWVSATHTLPARAGTVAYLDSYFAQNPAYPLTIDLLRFGVFEPSLPGYSAVRALSQEALGQIAAGAEAAATLGQLTEEANHILAEQVALIPESPDPWAEIDPSGQTITFWHNHTEGRAAALNEIVAEFNAANKWGITVVPEYQGGYTDIFLAMLPLLGTAEAPNLVVAYPFHAAAYQLGNGLTDLNSLVESPVWGLTPQEKEDFFSGIFEQDIFSVYEGARLGFPPQRSTNVLYYNADLLADLGYAAPPATPQEFQAMACAAARQGMGYSLQLNASGFASWVFAFGGNIFNQETNRYTLDDPAAVAAATLLQDLIDQGCAVLAADRTDAQTAFGEGSLLFMLDSSFYIPDVTASVESGAGFEWAVVPIPHTTSEPVQNLIGASISMPVGAPEKQLAAWLFLKSFTSPEAQAQWAQASNYLPVRQSAGEFLTDTFAASPATQTAFDLLTYGIAEPSVPGYDEVSDEVQQALIAILEGSDVTAILTSLNAAANQILAVHLER